MEKELALKYLSSIRRQMVMSNEEMKMEGVSGFAKDLVELRGMSINNMSWAVTDFILEQGKCACVAWLGLTC